MGFAARARFAWLLRSRSLALGQRTLVMAIVNVTPDSFSGDGLAGLSADEAVAEATASLNAGADILDLGAESTRPGAQPLSTDAEQARLLPVLEGVLRERPAAIVSVDTYHAATARAAIAAGAEIVNDVSGLLWDTSMAAVVAESGCGLVLMHARGKPTEWSALPPLADADLLPLVMGGLRQRMGIAERAGIAAEHIVVDPGFGFGKRGAENFALLAGLGELRTLGRPVLVGMSRKGFLGEAVRGVGGKDRVTAGIAAHTAAILAGAHVLRVHDVQEAREAAAVADAILAAVARG